MFHVNAPIILKIREGIAINLSMTTSFASEEKMEQKRVRPDIEAAIRAGTHKQALVASDYEVTGKTDTVSFWFIGGTSLSYRVGFEIDQADFDRITAQLNALMYRTKNDRKPSDNTAAA